LSLVVHRPVVGQQEWFDGLAASGRAMSAVIPGIQDVLWCATERRAWVEALFESPRFLPDHELPPTLAVSGAEDEGPDPDAAVAAALRGHLEVTGPATVGTLAARTMLARSRVQVGLARLENEGFAMRGNFDPEEAEEREQWCARRLLGRIHAYTQQRLRREIEPVSAEDFMRFLLRWQHVAPGTRRQGRAGLLAVIEQLQGFELAAGAWEESVFSSRVEQYRREWLEDLCLSGALVWGRLTLRPPGPDDTPRRGASIPSRATPVTFVLRDDLSVWLRATRGSSTPEEPAHGAARDVFDALKEHGAMFHSELRAVTGRLPVEVEEGLWDLVARGLVTADGFGAVRSLFSARERWNRRHQERRFRPGGRRASALRQGGEGRWALLPAQHGELADSEVVAEYVAGQLLERWGVVFWDITTRENLSVAWRELLWALRRLEARGLVRGGRFVTGFAGEQYALPEAVEQLRQVRRSERTGEFVRLSAADPLNLRGIVLPGTRIPAVRTHRVTYCDGSLVTDEGSARLQRAPSTHGRT